MNCLVFVGNGLEGTPIAELGGLVLQKDKAIIVPEKLGFDMKKHYGNKIIHVASVDKEKLSSGRFEIQDASNFKYDTIKETEVDSGICAQGEESIGENKSMQNKRKVKTK